MGIDADRRGTSPPWRSRRVPGKAARGLVSMALPDARRWRRTTGHRMVRRHLRPAGVPLGPLEAVPDLRRLRRCRPGQYLGSATALPAWCDVLAAERGWRPRTPTCTRSWYGASGSSRPCAGWTSRPSTPRRSGSRRGRSDSARQDVTRRSRWVPREVTTSGSRSDPTGREYRNPWAASQPSSMRRSPWAVSPRPRPPWRCPGPRAMATMVATRVESGLSSGAEAVTNDLSIFRVEHGEALEVGERRVLGAEVVDGHLHPQAAQLVQERRPRPRDPP